MTMVLNGSTPLARTYGGTGGTDIPAFSAWANTAQSMPANAATKVVFGAVEFDTNGFYNTTTGRFAPTIAGIYLVTSYVALSADLWLTTIYKNGAEFKRGDQRNLTGNSGMGVTALVQMNGTTDYLEIFCYAASATTVTNNSLQSYFQAILVRAS